MSAYYNEIDPEKAEWIRELIKAGVVAPGDVDERSISDVQPDNLRGYTQCHFFAGIGVWSYALRLAGWPDDREVWTGSCPCPSFSCAGKGEGFSDPRHLWPHWFRLIRECSPDVLLGEQVEAAIGHGWLDLVQDQLESADYAVGAAVLTAAGAGAPHIRSRLYFCADHDGERLTRRSESDSESLESRERTSRRNDALRCGHACQCTHTEHDGHDSPRRLASLTHSDQPQVGIFDRDCAAECGSHALHAERGTLLLDGDHGRHGKDNRRTETLSEFGTCGEVCRGATGDLCHAPQRGLAMRGSTPEECGHASCSDETGECLDATGNGCEVRQHLHGELHGERLGEGCSTVQRDHTLGAGLPLEQCSYAELSPCSCLGERRGQALPDSEAEGIAVGRQPVWRGPGWLQPEQCRAISESGATRGFWRDCDWWYGRDGKYRPIGPGLFPLASGAAARVLRLRGYGDAICAEAAKEFIAAYREARGN